MALATAFKSYIKLRPSLFLLHEDDRKTLWVRHWIGISAGGAGPGWVWLRSAGLSGRVSAWRQATVYSSGADHRAGGPPRTAAGAALVTLGLGRGSRLVNMQVRTESILLSTMSWLSLLITASLYLRFTIGMRGRLVCISAVSCDCPAIQLNHFLRGCVTTRNSTPQSTASISLLLDHISK